jgi:hypothetical protein
MRCVVAGLVIGVVSGFAWGQPLRLEARSEAFQLPCGRGARTVFVSPTHDRSVWVSPDVNGVRAVV